MVPFWFMSWFHSGLVSRFHHSSTPALSTTNGWNIFSFPQSVITTGCSGRSFSSVGVFEARYTKSWVGVVKVKTMTSSLHQLFHNQTIIS